MTRPLLNALPPDAHTSSLLRRFLQVVHQRLELPQRCSARRCSMFARPSRRIRRTNKNISSISNYFVAVSASDGFMDVVGGLTCVLECGEKHVVVFKQAVRQKEVPVVELTKDEATDFCSRASSTKCSVKERAEHRAGAGRNSAVLVCCQGKWSLTPCARQNRRRRIWRRPWWPKPRRCYTAGC